jgi:Fe-S-cluster-containing hydrogenase component 2
VISERLNDMAERGLIFRSRKTDTTKFGAIAFVHGIFEFQVKDRYTGCETCLDRCQTGALKLDEDQLIQVSKKQCIGCGLCVGTCPTGKLTLVSKPENELRLLPETTGAQMMEMARKRGQI